MAVDADALTTLASVQAHLGLSAGVDESLLETLINQASDIVEKHIGRAIKSATYTQYYDGDGSEDLILRNWPLISVTTLHVDTARSFPDGSLLTADTDYVVYKEDGRISLLTEPLRNQYGANVFPSSRKCIKVVYVAGYATVPNDLIWAANEMVAYLYDNRSAASAVASQSIGGFSESYNDAAGTDIPAHVRKVVDRYRDQPIAPMSMST
jgi:uncharacterized phiE125 gp8 family phage protein